MASPPLDCDCKLLEQEGHADICATLRQVEDHFCSSPYVSKADWPEDLYSNLNSAFYIYKNVCRPSVSLDEHPSPARSVPNNSKVFESLFGRGHLKLAVQLAAAGRKAAYRWRQRAAGGLPNFGFEIFDGLFPAHVMRAVAREASSLSLCDRLKIASSGAGTHIRKSMGMKLVLSDMTLVGPATRLLVAFLQTQAFTEFLQELTGVQDIIPDPTRHGGGMHITERDGLLRIHVDFNRLPNGLQRRVNILLFLNEDWEPEFGGQLEFWRGEDAGTAKVEHSGKVLGPPVPVHGKIATVGSFKARKLRCVARAVPSLGRLAVFQATDFSYHGHPHPLSCPRGRSRVSIALYYYTVGRPGTEVAREAGRPANSTMGIDMPCRGPLDVRCYAGVPLDV